MAEAASGSGLVHLTEVDVPDASLAEPLEKQSVPALKRWLLCRGIETPSYAKETATGTVTSVKCTSPEPDATLSVICFRGVQFHSGRGMPLCGYTDTQPFPHT